MTLHEMPRPALRDLVRRNAVRHGAYQRALRFLRHERIDGDVLEFGTFAGTSLALLAHASAVVDGHPRRVAGFDSFEGLPATADPHRKWGAGRFARNEWWHPTLKIGDPVSPDAVRHLFTACGLSEPALYAGWFEETVPHAVPHAHPQVALLHVDCDLYEPAAYVLRAVAPVLQDGAIVLFDDWFLYGGNPVRGEARALREFLDAHPRWGATDYGAYGLFSKAFILYRQ